MSSSLLCRLRHSFAQATPALLIFLLARLTAFLALNLFLFAKGNETLFQRLTTFDGDWYYNIARFGYGLVRSTPHFTYYDFAFFPLQPLLMRIPLFWGLDPQTSPYIAGILINNLGSFIAAWGIYAIAQQVLTKRAAVLSVGIWGALPPAGIFAFAYTEGLFLALASWCLYAVLRKYWLLAGMLSLAAGLTRPQGIPLAAAVVFSALWFLWQQQKLSWRPLAAILLSPLGFLGYMGWVGYRRGNIFGYFHVQSAWGNGLDGGIGFIRWMSSNFYWRPHIGLLASAVIGVVLWALVATFKQKLPVALLIFTTLLVVMSVVTGGFFPSRPRYLLPAFPLWFAVAASLDTRSDRTIKTTMAGAILLGAMIGGFALTSAVPP